MGWDYKYPHIPLLLTMRPTLRILLGQRLFWTEKKDGECVAIWENIRVYKKEKFVQISSRNLIDAKSDIVSRVQASEDYPKVLKLLEENPQFVIYVELCKKGRSVTGIELYDRNYLYVFDIFDKSSGKFLPYVNVHQHCFHHKIPVVALWAETRHRSVKDLLKWKNYALRHCEAVKLEGMVIKAYKIPKSVSEYYKEFKKGLIQAKVKLDIPEPTVRKIGRGEPILPPIPDNEIFGAIDKAWQDLGTDDFNDISKAMPLIAQYVGKECKRHLYSKPKTKLFHLYQEYLERMITNGDGN